MNTCVDVIGRGENACEIRIRLNCSASDAEALADEIYEAFFTEDDGEVEELEEAELEEIG